MEARDSNFSTNNRNMKQIQVISRRHIISGEQQISVGANFFKPISCDSNFLLLKYKSGAKVKKTPCHSTDVTKAWLGH